jgi:succinyl-diaminopimelate desuccinylase
LNAENDGKLRNLILNSTLTGDLISKISSDIDGDSKQMEEFFVEMLRINSVNPEGGGPGEAKRVDFLENFLKREGFKVSRVEAPDPKFGPRPNISAMIPGKDRSRTLWILSHSDTVPEGNRSLWNSDPFEPVVKDGKIIARGSEDNGQSLVASIFALREIKNLGIEIPFNFGIWAVADEEFGSKYGVKYLLREGYFSKNDLIVVPDAGTPDGKSIEIAEKNLLWLKVTTIGKQVHASLPKKGLNAHRIGMKLAIEIDEKLHNKYTAENSLFDDPQSTFEPTKVEPNVPNVNTLPGSDIFYFDCRVLPQYALDDVLTDVKAIIKKFESQFEGSKVELEVIQRDDAGPPTGRDSPIASLLTRAIKSVTGKDADLFGIGGQTVGNLFRRDGIPTVVWSTVDDVPHEPNEYSKIENLISDTKVFAAMPTLNED